MVCLKRLLNQEGQITIEFILIVVVLLAILSVVTFPVVEKMTDSAQDTSRAISLAAAQRRIINTAEEVSMGGCGSFKTIDVYIRPDVDSEPNIIWNTTHVWGNFSNSTLYEVNLTRLPFPKYIKLDKGFADGDCVGQNLTFYVTVLKDCSDVRPTTVSAPAGNINGVGVTVCK